MYTSSNETLVESADVWVCIQVGHGVSLQTCEYPAGVGQLAQCTHFAYLLCIGKTWIAGN